MYRNQRCTTIDLRVEGDHQVMNAVAAAALASQLGFSSSQIRTGLGAYEGIRRRFERRGVWQGMELVDDYAHHPTAVAATIRTAREVYPERRLWCVFQPHQRQRLSRMGEAFADALSESDEVLMVPVYSAREPGASERDEVTDKFLQLLTSRNSHTRFCPSLDHVLRIVNDERSDGDVLLVLGAGDIDRIFPMILASSEKTSTETD